MFKTVDKMSNKIFVNVCHSIQVRRQQPFLQPRLPSAPPPPPAFSARHPLRPALNVCHAIQVPEPPKITPEMLQNQENPVRLPLSLGEPREDTDAKGKPVSSSL